MSLGGTNSKYPMWKRLRESLSRALVDNTFRILTLGCLPPFRRSTNPKSFVRPKKRLIRWGTSRKWGRRWRLRRRSIFAKSGRRKYYSGQSGLIRLGAEFKWDKLNLALFKAHLWKHSLNSTLNPQKCKSYKSHLILKRNFRKYSSTKRMLSL